MVLTSLAGFFFESQVINLDIWIKVDDLTFKRGFKQVPRESLLFSSEVP